MKKKAIANYFVDVGLAITFLGAAITGILKFPKLLLLTGINKNIGLYKTITFVHDWSGIGMTILVIVHIVLHWRWIIIMTKKMLGNKK